MTTPQQQMPDANDLLMGGGGAPTGKFPTPGSVITGRITQKPTVEQQRDIKTGEAKFWNDGNPMLQIVVTVQTEERDPTIDEDDGKRRIFVKGAMKNAISDAVRNAGAKGLEVGGTLTVTYTHDGASKGPGMSPPKQYTAQYTAAAANALHTPDPGGMAQPASAPQQYAAAPPAPVQQQYVNPAQAAYQAQQQAVQHQAPAPTDTPPF